MFAPVTFAILPFAIMMGSSGSFDLGYLIFVPLAVVFAFIPWSVTLVGKPWVRYFHIGLNVIYTIGLTFFVLNVAAGPANLLGVAIAWTFYWVVSKRVKNTYAKTP